MKQERCGKRKAGRFVCNRKAGHDGDCSFTKCVCGKRANHRGSCRGLEQLLSFFQVGGR